MINGHLPKIDTLPWPQTPEITHIINAMMTNPLPPGLYIGNFYRALKSDSRRSPEHKQGTILINAPSDINVRRMEFSFQDAKITASDLPKYPEILIVSKKGEYFSFFQNIQMLISDAIALGAPEIVVGLNGLDLESCHRLIDYCQTRLSEMPTRCICISNWGNEDGFDDDKFEDLAHGKSLVEQYYPRGLGGIDTVFTYKI